MLKKFKILSMFIVLFIMAVAPSIGSSKQGLKPSITLTPMRSARIAPRAICDLGANYATPPRGQFFEVQVQCVAPDSSVRLVDTQDSSKQYLVYVDDRNQARASRVSAVLNKAQSAGRNIFGLQVIFMVMTPFHVLKQSSFQTRTPLIYRVVQPARRELLTIVKFQ